jgi:sec-independent protein translocase protein TatA
MIGSLGWQELLIILVILALLFGASRVAGLGGALGKGIREFRREARGDDDGEGGSGGDSDGGDAAASGSTSGGSSSSDKGGSS